MHLGSVAFAKRWREQEVHTSRDAVTMDNGRLNKRPLCSSHWLFQTHTTAHTHMPSNTHAHLPLWIITGFPLSFPVSLSLADRPPARPRPQRGSSHITLPIHIYRSSDGRRSRDLLLVSPQTNFDAQNVRPAHWLHLNGISLDYK